MPQIVSESQYEEITAVAVERTSRKQDREKLIAILPEVATHVAAALSAVGLAIPVFVSVPNSGDAIVTVGSPLDTVDSDWDRVCAIVCEIVEARTGMRNLTAKELPCCSAGMQTIGVAELHAEADEVAGPKS